MIGILQMRTVCEVQGWPLVDNWVAWGQCNYLPPHQGKIIPTDTTLHSPFAQMLAGGGSQSDGAEESGVQ